MRRDALPELPDGRPDSMSENSYTFCAKRVGLCSTFLDYLLLPSGVLEKLVHKYRFQGGVTIHESHKETRKIQTKGLLTCHFVLPFRVISWIVRYSDPDQLAGNVETGH